MPDNLAQDTKRRPEVRGRSGAKRLPFVIITLAALAFFVAVTLADSRAPSPEGSGSVEPSSASVPGRQEIDFSKFLHTNPQHARLPCLLCHRREDNSPRPRRPGHTPCSGCHTQEFQNSLSPVCVICHTDTQSGALKAFPPLRSFNVRFDHALHTRGGAAPRQTCATCHKPERRGVSLSIPSGFAAHTTCYQCHAPQAQSGGRDISSCGTCHRVGGYSRTPETAQAYRVNFSHSAHTSRGLACAECHGVVAGASQRRQVTAPVALMHHAPKGARSCASCYDDKRAFGGDDFKDCTRCHKGDAWHF
jgi:c(7)-type cytochrome triheme protein